MSAPQSPDSHSPGNPESTASEKHDAAGLVPSGMEPHQVREHEDETHTIFEENATYEDSSQPGTVAVAADQPYMVKDRQRQDYSDGDRSEADQDKVASPLKLTGATWKYSLKRTLSEFSRDQGTDLAAALTYYSVLSVFPALIALVSILSLAGEDERVTSFFVDTVADMTNNDRAVMDTVELIVSNIMVSQGAGLGLVIGILTALWTASNYVNAFSRALNRIWEVEEGRSFLQLRPMLYLITAVLIVLVALSGLMLVLSGPFAQAVGNTIGLGDLAVTVWNWATPFVMLLVAVLAIGLLYYCTPNIKQPGAKWTSAGALITILVMALTTVGVAIYVINFASYDATYGSLASVIIFLFWIYIMNIVMLLGAELNSELERGRQLQAGIEAERTIMLPVRQSKAAEKKDAKYEQVVAEGQAIRLSKGETNNPEDLWRR